MDRLNVFENTNNKRSIDYLITDKVEKSFFSKDFQDNFFVKLNFDGVVVGFVNKKKVKKERYENLSYKYSYSLVRFDEFKSNFLDCSFMALVSFYQNEKTVNENTNFLIDKKGVIYGRTDSSLSSAIGHVNAAKFKPIYDAID